MDDELVSKQDKIDIMRSHDQILGRQEAALAGWRRELEATVHNDKSVATAFATYKDASDIATALLSTQLLKDRNDLLCCDPPYATYCDPVFKAADKLFKAEDKLERAVDDFRKRHPSLSATTKYSKARAEAAEELNDSESIHLSITSRCRSYPEDEGIEDAYQAYGLVYTDYGVLQRKYMECLELGGDYSEFTVPLSNVKTAKTKAYNRLNSKLNTVSPGSGRPSINELLQKYEGQPSELS